MDNQPSLNNRRKPVFFRIKNLPRVRKTTKKIIFSTFCCCIYLLKVAIVYSSDGNTTRSSGEASVSCNGCHFPHFVTAIFFEDTTGKSICR
nr:MAG TPA: hypothetical protein [Caudoviricetes sp.]